jgi:hypothetical protein
MFVSLTWSNLLATGAVVSLPIVGRSWVASKLSPSTRRFFFALTLWGIPFVLGQYSQEDEWGSVWVQYHLLDLSYAPWGTALVMCAFTLGAAVLNREVTKRVLLVSSFGVILAIGYGTEIWDTLWAWHTFGSFPLAIDVGDYVTITAGGVATLVFYVWFRQADSKGVMS